MPGQYYVYIPFADGHAGDLVSGANAWRREMQGTGRKMPRKIQHGQGPRPLADLPADPSTYTLYIMGHGNVGRKTIANMRYMTASDRETIGAAQLASRLQADGMPKNIVNVKLWACYGGVTMGRYFYHALITRGFNDVILSAYTLPLLSSPGSDGHKRAMDLQTKQVSRPSTVRVQWPR